MAERYLDLDRLDRREVLDVAASASGRPAYLLEKDIWVVWSLETLFGDPLGAPLVFKGGTSLSKAYGAIRRFSEDFDLTYDIRALVPELVRDQPNALPPNRSQERKWTKAVREALARGHMMSPCRRSCGRCGSSSRTEKSRSKKATCSSATSR